MWKGVAGAAIALGREFHRSTGAVSRAFRDERLDVGFKCDIVLANRHAQVFILESVVVSDASLDRWVSRDKGWR